MKKYFYSLLPLLATVLLLTSCGNTKNVAYMKNSDWIDFAKSEYLYDAKIMPKDVLTITVSTVNPEAAAPFNLNVPTTFNINTRSTYSQPVIQTYLVSNDGTIDFPVVGTLHVGGLTKQACEQMIHDRIMRYINATENPVVTVRMSNYKVSVIGEVNRPGIFTIGNEKVNIFEALAQAGDLTIYGVRDRVKLIRENDKGRKEIITLNLNDADIISSPYYYLQQNDIVYVEPNAVKARNASIGQSTNLWFTGTSILISLATLLYTIFK